MAAELGDGYVSRNSAIHKRMSTDQFANKMMALFWSGMIEHDGEPPFVERFAKNVGFNKGLEEEE